MHTFHKRAALLRRGLCLAALAGPGLLAATAAATGTTTVKAFDAQFRETPCAGAALCGAGTLAGFGRTKTELKFGHSLVPPAPGCQAVTGTRTLTLEKDASSTLRLTVQGPACGSRVWGTFKVLSGTGVFDKATGSGVILGALTKSGGDSVRYFGVLTLAK
jgi:hypothetical protein